MPHSSFARAQAAAVDARNRQSLAALPEAMVRFSLLPEASRSVKGLARELGWSVPTVHRWFGHRRPVGGAYVLTVCVLLAPIGRTIVDLTGPASPFAGKHGRTTIRAVSYAVLAVLMRNAELVARAHEQSLAGVDLRAADLSLLGVAGSAASDRQALPVGYLPVLTSAAGRTLLSVGGSSADAVAMARRLVELAIAHPGGNVTGEVNRFMDWAGPILGVAHHESSDAELDESWLVAQMAERFTLFEPSPSLSDLYALLASELSSRPS